MKYILSYGKTKKKSHKKKHPRYYGGSSNGLNTTSAKPFQMYGLPTGASSMRDAAIIKQQQMNKTQQSLITLHGGKNNKTRKTKYSKNKRGGSSKNTIVVPSFSQGSNISPNNPTNLSKTGNQTSLQALANSSGDCWATNTCSGGGRKTTRKNKMGRGKTGGFKNWYNAFPPGSFGKRNTGGGSSKNNTLKWGCMSGGFSGIDRSIAGKRMNVRDRFPQSGYSAGHWTND